MRRTWHRLNLTLLLTFVAAACYVFVQTTIFSDALTSLSYDEMKAATFINSAQQNRAIGTNHTQDTIKADIFEANYLKTVFPDNMTNLQDVQSITELNISDLSAFGPFGGDKEYTVAMAREALEPVQWNCDLWNKNFSSHVSPLHKQKIYSFVHIYKTAGSTLRNFFYKYSKKCHRGWTLLIWCSNANGNTISSGQTWKPCVKKQSLYRDGSVEQEISKEFQTINNQQIEREVDIFGGHFKLGIGDYLKNPVQYITFLREPKMKFVSSKIFSYKETTQDEIIYIIKKEVTGNIRRGQYYMRIADYLLTPFQMEDVKNETAAQKAQIVINNLINRKVIIGLTENMSDSMEILQHVFDPERQMTRLFEIFGMDVGNKTIVASEKMRSRQVFRNKSRFSSSAVMQELQYDKDFMENFVEYVKYEKMIYDVAVTMHRKQHKLVKLMKTR